MKNIFRGNISHHGGYFRLVIIPTELSIENGEFLFSVDYKDFYIDDNYLDESDGGSDGDFDSDDNE
jgi:hypothetical protein